MAGGFSIRGKGLNPDLPSPLLGVGQLAVSNDQFGNLGGHLRLRFAKKQTNNDTSLSMPQLVLPISGLGHLQEC